MTSAAFSSTERRAPVFPLLLAVWLAAYALPGFAADTGSALPAPEYSNKGADTCLVCHRNDAVLGVFQGRHGVPDDPHGPFGEGQLQCEACHGPSGAHATMRPGATTVRFGRDAATPHADQNAMCIDCHDADTGVAWHAGPHADEALCGDCHRVHQPTDPMRHPDAQTDTCLTCHTMLRAAVRQPFGHADRLQCTGCHAVHGDHAAGTLARATLNDTCHECHADLRGPFLWEHAPASEDCSLCHAVHGSQHPAMLKRRGPLLCQSCHAEAGHPSVARGPEALADRSRFMIGRNCMNCHSQVHGSNHPSGAKLLR